MRKCLVGFMAAILVLIFALPALADTVPESVYAPPPPCPPKSQGKHCRPDDVAPDNFAAQAIANLKDSGIIQGYPDNTFHPDEKLTTGQATTIILRVLGQNPQPSTTGNWADNAMQQAQKQGLVSQSQTQNPDQPMTRADMAVVIAKALGLQPVTNPVALPWSDIDNAGATTEGYLIALYNAGVFKGYPDGTFQPDSTLSRAEVAILVDRILAKFSTH